MPADDGTVHHPMSAGHTNPNDLHHLPTDPCAAPPQDFNLTGTENEKFYSQHPQHNKRKNKCCSKKFLDIFDNWYV